MTQHKIEKRKIKLWVDDVRRPPGDSWEWARTNDQAKAFLLRNDVVEASLDHDMGGHTVNPDDPESYFIAGHSEDNGFRLVEWMVEKDIIPPKIRIHSWNPSGARRMANLLNDYGYDCEIREYSMTLDNPKRI